MKENYQKIFRMACNDVRTHGNKPGCSQGENTVSLLRGQQGKWDGKGWYREGNRWLSWTWLADCSRALPTTPGLEKPSNTDAVHGTCSALPWSLKNNQTCMMRGIVSLSLTPSFLILWPPNILGDGYFTDGYSPYSFTDICVSRVQHDTSPIVQVSLPHGLSGVKRRNVSSSSSFLFFTVGIYQVFLIHHLSGILYLVKGDYTADCPPSNRAQTILWDLMSQIETFCLLDDFRPLKGNAFYTTIT